MLKTVSKNGLESWTSRAPQRADLSPQRFWHVIGKFIYNTVTTFFVGEKIMIQVPTWFFPAGAGPYSEDGNVTLTAIQTPKPHSASPSR